MRSSSIFVVAAQLEAQAAIFGTMHTTSAALALAAGSLALYALYRRRTSRQDAANELTEHEVEVRRFDEHVASDPRVLPCRLSKPFILGICGYDPSSEKVSEYIIVPLF